MWKTINAHLWAGGVYGFAVCVYGFLGGGESSFSYVREVGLPSLSLCGGGWVG